jgi:regulatory protein
VWSTPALVDDVVLALKRYGYVNDEDFARRFAERRATGGHSGARLLRLELRAKGVEDREVIEDAVREAFERAPEADTIDNLIAKRLRLRPIRDRDDVRRLRDFLLRRGFDPETVYDRVRGLGKDMADQE